MTLKGVIDFKPVADSFTSSEREVPYVAAITLTKLVGDAQAGIKTAMPEVFSRVADFTLRGVYTRSASKSKLESEVYIPDSPDNHGKSTREYLRPGAVGASARNQKRSEYLLTRMGALPAGWVTTPGKGLVKQGDGNLGPVYKQIINVLQIRGDAKPVSQRSQKGAKRLGVAALFFVVAPGPNNRGKNGGWLPPGVWKHLPGGDIAQILKFVKKASYKPRLDLKKIATAVVQKNLVPRWRESAEIIKQKFAKSEDR
ncbi:MAG: hypothetical protein V4641_02255 [Pseudomonadota bacterium]